MELEATAVPGEVTFEVGLWKEEDLAKRLSLLVYGAHPSLPQRVDGGWDLGANDWRLHVDGPLARINYRYPNSYPDDYWPALRAVLEHALHGAGYTRGKYARLGRRTE
jgi:hypothetical protein